jgi:hypothetical protein
MASVSWTTPYTDKRVLHEDSLEMDKNFVKGINLTDISRALKEEKYADLHLGKHRRKL